VSGFVAVPNAALAVCRDHAERYAVFDLATMADENRWGPFEAPEGMLGLRWGMGNRKANALLDRLVAAGVLQILKSPLRSQARRIVMACPTVQQGCSKDAARMQQDLQQGTSIIPDTSDDSAASGAARMQQGCSKDAATRARVVEILDPDSQTHTQTPDRISVPKGTSVEPAAAGPTLPPEPIPDPPPEVSAPKPERKPDPAVEGGRQVWAAYLAHHPTAGHDDGKGGRRCPDGDRKLVLAAVRAWGAEDVIAVIDWAHLAPDDYAALLREGKFTTLGNLLPASKLSKKVEPARAWVGAGRPSQRASPETDRWSRPRRDEGMTLDWFRPKADAAAAAEDPYTIDVPPLRAASGMQPW
jgi:hypothetical protein